MQDRRCICRLRIPVAEEAEEWKAEVENRFPEYEVHMDPLSLSVACHIGHGARAIACSRKVPELS